MLGKASSLGCATSDYACLCKNMDFGFGVRDCSTALCAAQKPPVDPTQIISVGNSFCARSFPPPKPTPQRPIEPLTNVMPTEVAAGASGGSGSVATVAQTVLTGTTAVSAGGAAAGVITTTNSAGSTYTTTTGGAAATGATGSSGNGTSSLGGSGTNGTSSTNGTSGGLLGGGRVITTTNSLGSTITSTVSPFPLPTIPIV